MPYASEVLVKVVWREQGFFLVFVRMVWIAHGPCVPFLAKSEIPLSPFSKGEPEAGLCCKGRSKQKDPTIGNLSTGIMEDTEPDSGAHSSPL